MEMAALRERMLQLGFRFNPTPQEAVTHTLPRLIAGEPLHPAIRPYLHQTDIYACEPGVLAAHFQPTPRTGDRFFFTSCKRQPQKAGKSSRAVRAAGPGAWHSQGNTTDVKDGAGIKIGEVKKLRYKKGGKFTDWLMDEFSCCSEDAVVGDRQRVLCKIYVSPRAGPDSAARQEATAAAFAPPVPEETVVAPKRPAPPVVEQPCPKRPRCTVVPTPPVQAPEPRRSPPQLSIQTSTVVAQAACSPVAARDPFCRESPATAKDDDDFELVKFLEGNLETEQAEEDEAQDDTDCEILTDLESWIRGEGIVNDQTGRIRGSSVMWPCGQFGNGEREQIKHYGEEVNLFVRRHRDDALFLPASKGLYKSNDNVVMSDLAEFL
ncbi:hypothetical protein EJB05_02179, partial [Eragrostis curvula]